METTVCGSFTVLVLAAFVFSGEHVVADHGFTHRESLDEEGKFQLLWKFDDEKIEFEAQVQTTGWVGLGLSPNGGMPGSDIAIGWVKDGTAHLTDRFAEAKAQPPVDESQDWELVSGSENGTHTVLRFSRKLTTCDDKDRVINEDTMRVLWAWHDDDPEDESGVSGPAYHGANRGVRSTVLLSNIIAPPNLKETNITTFDILMNNVSVPEQDTVYWCRVFQLPELASKHHMIKYEPITTPGNEGVVHHLLIYTCPADQSVTFLPEEHPGHRCRSPNMPRDWWPCYGGSLMAAWAIGSEGIVYPEHVGFPVGGADDSRYVLVEMHYDNPHLASGIRDSSGLRLTLTPELRDNDLSILEVGMMVTKLHVVPPRAEGFVSAGFCNTNCLNAFLEELGEPIHIIGLELHSHLLGSKMSTRVIHDGTETEIARDDNYDFNLQFFRMLKQEVTVYPGDTLITECTYRSTQKDEVTYGGLGTTDEMCKTFFLYYPRFNLTFCDSLPNLAGTVRFAGVENFEFTGGQRGDREIVIKAPEPLVNKSFEEVMEAVPWTDEKTRDFSKSLLDGPLPFHTNCRATYQTAVNTAALGTQSVPFPRGKRTAPNDICSGRTPAGQATTRVPAVGTGPGQATTRAPVVGDGSGASRSGLPALTAIVCMAALALITVWKP
ncbi:DBH-like monooxygenase protein 1 homolog [Branchiostoma floridae]|uniref:DBH-like monooxygenase protein 1 homolog n=1 Tax=Branchiostoma floridae TaxID=7739 RepID=A0A9J7NA38_BRAFL|nr:DBH-like monooxygenase protein 1 homolog [Branchiostoma floridae]